MRNIVISCDGTDNRVSEYISNVRELCRCLAQQDFNAILGLVTEAR
jgi:hypothetical protein